MITVSKSDIVRGLVVSGEYKKALGIVRGFRLGIKKEDLPKIFKPFEQSEAHKNRNISGTGLGLAISNNLAKLMEGNIFAKSEYGVGSEFTVRIPQAAVSNDTIADVKNRKEKKVLLVTTNREFSALVERFLCSLGVPHKAVFDYDMFHDVLREESFTHIVIDNELKLAEKIAEMYPSISVGCMQNISGFVLNVSNDIKIIFKPFYIVGLVMFINGVYSKKESNTKKSDKLGSRSFKGARVLIVDDNEINLIVASEIIKTYDIEPEMAYSGFEAIEKVKNTKYDLVFMDHMMPGMDGLEATTKIRKLNIQQPAIIALTANAMSGMEEFYIKNGFDGYIPKPIDLNSLHSILEGWLDGSD